jgi:predicted CoA-binding protein
MNDFAPNAPNDRVLRGILAARPAIALVGASPRAERPSHDVMSHLLAMGHDVIPVNPHHREILGRACYPDLAAIPRRIELVDVFRRVEACPDLARAAVASGARVLWLQVGVVSEEAAAIAREAGLVVVMDHCLAVEHDRLIGGHVAPRATPAEGFGPIGLCADCRHSQQVPAPRAMYWLCRRAATDPSFPKYPRLPVRACRGFQWREDATAERSGA